LRVDLLRPSFARCEAGLKAGVKGPFFQLTDQMSCTIDRFSRVFFVLWHAPAVEDTRRVLEELEKAHRSVGRPLIYVAVITEETAPPSDATRRAMDEGLRRAYECCETLHFVVEGHGFKHTILRTILAANILATGKRGRTFVDASFEEAVARAPDAVKQELAAATRYARLRGLVHGSSATLRVATPVEPRKVAR
jgi:hypothetical protein